MTVYILYSKTLDRFYVGHTDNFEKRFAEHLSHQHPGSFTAKASDWTLYHSIECSNRMQARSLESFIKKMRNRQFYERLRQEKDLVAGLLERFALQ